MELGHPDSYNQFREKIRFNRNGYSSKWDWTSQSEKSFVNNYSMCSYSYSDKRLSNGTNEVRAEGGQVDSDALTMSLEFSRPFDIPVDNSITLVANETLKVWL